MLFEDVEGFVDTAEFEVEVSGLEGLRVQLEQGLAEHHVVAHLFGEQCRRVNVSGLREQLMNLTRRELVQSISQLEVRMPHHLLPHLPCSRTFILLLLFPLLLLLPSLLL